MDELKKMVTAIANAQSAFRAEMLQMFKKVDERFDALETKMDNRFREVHDRLDKIGLQVARLEDDAPTREEHDVLVKRVTKVEKRTASA